MQTLENTGSVTVVLVTNQFECERIINAAKIVSTATETPLVVLSVQSNEYPPNPEAIDYLYGISSKNGATMNAVYSEDVLKTIKRYLKINNVTNIVSGMPGNTESILHKLWSRFPSISFYTIDNRGAIHDMSVSCELA